MPENLEKHRTDIECAFNLLKEEKINYDAAMQKLERGDLSLAQRRGIKQKADFGRPTIYHQPG